MLRRRKEPVDMSKSAHIGLTVFLLAMPGLLHGDLPPRQSPVQAMKKEIVTTSL